MIPDYLLIPDHKPLGVNRSSEARTMKLNRAQASTDQLGVAVVVVGFEEKQKVGKRFDPRPSPRLIVFP